MAIPSASERPAGGDIVAAINAISEMQKAHYGQKYEKEKANWADLSIPAQAYSQLAYANNVMPQWQSKALGNQRITANLDANQPGATQNMLGNLATYGNSPNPIAALINNFQNRPKEQSFGMKGLNYLGNLFGFGGNEQQQNSNPMRSMPNMQQNMQRPQNNGPEAQMMANAPNQIPSEYVPVNDQNQDIVAADNKAKTNLQQMSFEDNANIAAGNTKQAEVSGAKRGEIVDELGKEYKALGDLNAPYKVLREVFTDPEFKNLLQVPAFRQTQLDVLKNYTGSKKQKALISKLEVATGQILANTVKGMGNKAPASEITFANNIKIPKDETVDVLIPKLQTLMEFSDLQKERVKMAAQLVDKKHIPEYEAFDTADKRLNGDAIRAKVAQQFKPKITSNHIERMAKDNNISIEEVKKRLTAKGLL